MTDAILDKLVSDGSIDKYEHKREKDGFDDYTHEHVTIYFNDGNKVTISVGGRNVDFLNIY